MILKTPSRRASPRDAMAAPPKGFLLVRGARLAHLLPPCLHAVGDDAGGMHRRLAELGIASDLALHTLALALQRVAQALEFAQQPVDLAQGRAGDALHQ